MLKTRVTITPIANIKDGKIQNICFVYQEEYDSLEDMFILENKNGIQRRSNLINAKYDDLIVRGNSKFIILTILTK